MRTRNYKFRLSNRSVNANIQVLMNPIQHLSVRNKNTGHSVAFGKSIQELLTKLPQLPGLSEEQSLAVRKKLESATVPPEEQPIDLSNGYELYHHTLNVSKQ